MVYPGVYELACYCRLVYFVLFLFSQFAVYTPYYHNPKLSGVPFYFARLARSEKRHIDLVVQRHQVVFPSANRIDFLNRQ